jgi:CubicO group peptidase (beta-lactamase class C family)
MERSRLYALAVLAMIAVPLACGCPSRQAEKAAAATPAAPADPYVGTLQPLIEEMVRRQEIPGLAIALVDDGKVVYAHGFGVQSLGSKDRAPTTPRTLFHMASITKTFVATAVMQLVERGRIELDAPVTTYLPYFKMADPRAGTITILQMLTHTSGIPDVDDYEWDKPQYDDGALERYVRSLKDTKLAFAPGERFQYSNMAYEILGDVVAKVSGMSFEDDVHRNILQPLAMRDSTLLVKEANPALMSWGHELGGDGHPFPSRFYPYNRMHTPSSDLHSNALDMTRWAIANLDGGVLDGKRFLEKPTHDRMWTASRPIQGADDPNERRQEIGLAWFLGHHRGHRTVSHGGGDTGYVTDLMLMPEGRKAVVWMANVDFIGQGPLTRAALDVLLGVKPEKIDAKRGAAGVLVAAYRAGGLEAALGKYAAIKASQADLYDLGEEQLNGFGYFLLGEKHVGEAIRIFKLNIDAFPKSANAQDSLGEAHEAAGDQAAAKASYERALKLDPGFTHAADALKKLQGRN